MTMTMRYRFADLTNLADFFDERAKQFREWATGGDHQTKPQHRDYQIEAATWEAAARVIRATTLEEKTD